MQPDQDIPDPHQDWRGPRQQKPRNLLRQAYKWAFTNLLMEPLATIAMYSVRVIDRNTGIPYSADELEAKILAAAGAGPHTHVGADITDLTNNGITNPGKPLRSSTGLLDGPLTLPEVMVSGFGYTMTIGPVVNTLTNSGNEYFHTHPFASGVYGVLRSYADSTAANAAVSVGDAWWDTTLNKARVRLS